MLEYLIWSEEHGAWWPNRCGYTLRMSDAGRYSHEEATAIARSANGGDLAFNETAVPFTRAMRAATELKGRGR